MKPICIGQWLFYPWLLVAQNCHNGTMAQFLPSNNGWVVVCVNCPSRWMLDELAKWFVKWVSTEELKAAA